MTDIIKVLIVEDDTQIAHIQQRFLDRIEGIQLCGIAHSLTDAQDLVEVFQPQLVLLDVYLPDGSGLDQLRQWRVDNAELDVILITAAKEVETLRSALHAGVFDYILKPLVFERLAESIQRYRQHLAQLNQLNHLEQPELDSIIAGHKSAAEVPSKPRLPKGIDSLTLEKIVQFMRTSQPATADEVGKRMGASRTTARRYLEYMVSTHRLIAEVTYGSVGRPERRYRWDASSE